MIRGIECRNIIMNDRDRKDFLERLSKLLSKRELARRLEMSPPAIGYSVERGEAIAHENGYRVIE
jgi:hypothetical protein